MLLGEKILELRKKNGLSQEQLGDKVNVTRQTISNWELGETSPNPEQLKLLSKALNISIDDLLDNDIKNVVVEKISNTEKLAGVVLKGLKILGIIILIIVIIDITALILFSTLRVSTITKESTKVEMNCIKGNTTYMITVDTDENYTCDNCSKEMFKEIKNIVDYSDLDLTVRNIENYFKKLVVMPYDYYDNNINVISDYKSFMDLITAKKKLGALLDKITIKGDFEAAIEFFDSIKPVKKTAKKTTTAKAAIKKAEPKKTAEKKPATKKTTAKKDEPEKKTVKKAAKKESETTKMTENTQKTVAEKEKTSIEKVVEKESKPAKKQAKK